MTICERIFDIIEEKRLKASELAKKLEIKQSVISNWKKRNTNPPIEYSVVICEFLEISLEYLITGKEKQEGLTEYETEMLKHFRQIPEQIQLRELGRLESKAEQYFSGKSSDSKIG